MNVPKTPLPGDLPWMTLNVLIFFFLYDFSSLFSLVYLTTLFLFYFSFRNIVHLSPEQDGNKWEKHFYPISHIIYQKKKKNCPECDESLRQMTETSATSSYLINIVLWLRHSLEVKLIRVNFTEFGLSLVFVLFFFPLFNIFPNLALAVCAQTIILASLELKSEKILLDIYSFMVSE